MDGQLFSLNARDGKVTPDFGEGGYLNLKEDMIPRGPDRFYGVASPPLIHKDLVITGSTVPDALPQFVKGEYFHRSRRRAA